MQTYLRTIGPVAGLSVIALLIVLAPGCAWKGEGDGARPATRAEHWSIRPVSMRVFPSTRFIDVEGRTMLETRIEMADEAGDTTKAVGQFHFELFRDEPATPAGTPAPATGRMLYSWDVPMHTLDQNREFFDPVTRTYLCRLKVDEPEITREPSMLRVTFEPVDGDRLTAQAMIDSMRRPAR